jgi:fatty-acid peroxygenase
MLQDVTCVVGQDAARMFYAPDRFTRRGALPPNSLLLLQDFGSAAVLDGAAHHWRKRMLMSLMTEQSIQRLVELMSREWRLQIENWQQRAQVVLDDAVQEVLCRAVCAWVGLNLSDQDLRRRAREFGAMFEGSGSIGPRNWYGLILRRRTERWAKRIIRAVRAGTLAVPGGSAVEVIARHRNENGELLSVADAAVELINILRPTVAVSRFITFAALALHTYPETRRDLLGAGAADDSVECFVHEVRRYYPFFPMVGGRAREQFVWRGEEFRPGTWVLLDVYGTNHDARSWVEPGVFRPERFRDWKHDPFNFLPQGGGAEYETTHRCAGEWLTVALMKEGVRLLTTAMQYDVPPQDLRVDLSRLPSVPRSRFVIANVRPAA